MSKIFIAIMIMIGSSTVVCAEHSHRCRVVRKPRVCYKPVACIKKQIIKEINTAPAMPKWATSGKFFETLQ